MAEEFDGKVKIDTSDAVKALKGVVTELDKTNRSSKALANDGLKAVTAAKKNAEKASRDLEKAQKDSQQKAQALTSGLRGVTDQVGRMSPAIGNAVSSIGSMTSNTVALAGAMGPVGIAIGAVTAAITFMTSETEASVSVVDRVTSSLGEMRTEMLQVTAAVESTEAAQRSYNELMTGAASPERTAAGYRAAVEIVSDLQTQLAQAEAQQRRLGSVDVFGTMADNVGNLRAQLAGARRDQRRLGEAMEASRDSARIAADREAVATADAAYQARRLRESEDERAKAMANAALSMREQAEAERRAETSSRERLRHEQDRIKLLERSNRFMHEEAIRDREQMDRRVTEAIREEERVVEQERQLKLAQTARHEAEEERAADLEYRENLKVKMDQQIADEAAINALKERQISIQQRASAGMEGVLDIAMRTRQLQEETNLSFAEALRQSIKEFLASFAIEQAYKAIGALAEGISLSVTNTAGAATKFAAAAMHAGIAAAAGGASLAIPAAGAGASAPAASPDAAGDQGGGSGGGSVVVNFNTPVVEAELGRMNARAQREAERTFGRV